MESTYAINDPKAIYEDDHGGDDHGDDDHGDDDHHEEPDLQPFFQDDMDIYAVAVGGAIIVITIIVSLIIYKLKKDSQIKKSIFREIEDEGNDD
jgi:hypothetical protein